MSEPDVYFNDVGLFYQRACDRLSINRKKTQITTRKNVPNVSEKAINLSITELSTCNCCTM